MVNLELKPDRSDPERSPDNNNNRQNNIRILLVDDRNTVREYLG